MRKRTGKQTVRIESHPYIISARSVVGPKEGEGPLHEYFDEILKDDKNGQKSFEKAESSFMYKAITGAINEAGLKNDDINYLLAGDLLNQTISSNYTARDLEIPYFGLYGACSTMAESLSLASILIDGGFADYVVAATSSHFSSAERQYRFPLEYGSQKAECTQRTVTASGAMVLASQSNIEDKSRVYPYISYITTGKVKDYGILDSANMGAAMAPAAVDTMYNHFRDTGRNPDYYDVILTGDLGNFGRDITTKLIKEYGYDVSNVYNDCGSMIFNDDEQNTKCGGSGCGCSASVACGYLYKKMIDGEITKALLISTGALMSPTATYQGETVPGIAHAVAIEI